MSDSAVQTTLQYHEQTKHHFHRFARALGYLDWNTQPNPFRCYEGTDSVRLPFAKEDPKASYLDLYERQRNQTQPFSLESLSLFLELSLGLSAWKSLPGARWALRMNPSSGNLHPTESYVMLYTGRECRPGVYHYNPFFHALEPRASFPEEASRLFISSFGPQGFLFALTSIHWREAWKYGERAFRYCNHDVGHAIASSSVAANLLGWTVSYLREVTDDEMEAMLGFDRIAWPEHEEEYPEVLCCVHPSDSTDMIPRIPQDLLSHVRAVSFQGTPNRLSRDHTPWEIIPGVATSTRKSVITSPHSMHHPESPFLVTNETTGLVAARLIRQRRSAVAFDGETRISQHQFTAVLDKTLPRKGCAPFDFGLGPVRVHLLLFVHRVTGLAPGLYMFVRDHRDLALLKSSCQPEFLWKQADNDVPLYLLSEGWLMRETTAVSCQQPIAGDSSFSLGMIARFRSTIEENPSLYRHLFWETGMIGQVLYLEAEAHGVRGTGIGCFFDDPVHNLMGLKDDTFQSLYHFTIGGPVEDARLQTWPPYFHLKENIVDPSAVIHFDLP